MGFKPVIFQTQYGPHSITLIGEDHSQPFTDNTLVDIVKAIQSGTLRRPLILAEARAHEWEDEEPDTTINTRLFMENAPPQMPPVIFFAYAYGNKLDLNGAEIIAFDLRNQDVQDLGAALDDSIIQDPNLAEGWIQDFSDAWERQLARARAVAPPGFEAQVRATLDAIGGILRRSPISVEALDVMMTANNHLWMQVSDQGMEYHLQKLKRDSQPRDVFVFIGHEHMPNSINIVTKRP